MIKIILNNLLTIIFPQSQHECIVQKLEGVFPAHISTHKINYGKKRKTIQATALSDYADKRVVSLIHTLKYAGNPEALKIISKMLADTLLEEVSNHNMMYDCNNIVIIPIPISEKRRQKRGFNQVELLLNRVKQLYPDLNEYIRYDILIKSRDTKSQTHLKRKERLNNVKNSFRCITNSVYQLDVLLIDDVLTTGATSLEAAKTLLKAGVNSVRIITIARTL